MIGARERTHVSPLGRVERRRLRRKLAPHGASLYRLKREMLRLGFGAKDTVIVLLRKDNPESGALIKDLIPSFFHKERRDLGGTKLTLGFVQREDMEHALYTHNKVAGDALREIEDDMAVVFINRDHAEVFRIAEVFFV